MTIEARKIRLIMALRGSGVADGRVLNAIERIPRELFVPDAFQDQAYEDRALPIGHGQTISQPRVVALMTEALMVGERHRVLEVGTGSGYQASVLAKICRRVYTIERVRLLLQEADARFRALKLHNITTRFGDGSRGWPEAAPFDRILVTAGAGFDPPPALIDQLGPEGILIIPLGDRTDQKVVRFRRTVAGVIREELWPVRFVPLLSDTQGTAEPSRPPS